MSLKDRVKVRIGLTDELQDALIKEIIDNVKSELIMRLPEKLAIVPKELEFIVVEVAVKRYNRTGSEGMTSESIDGRSNSFEDDDFKQYAGIIDGYFEKNDGMGEVLFF